MSQKDLKVQKRTTLGKEASKVLRRNGELPAVLYGHNEPAVALTVSAREFGDLVQHHGHHVLVNLQGGDVAETAIIKQVQRHPYRGTFSTIDFQRVSATEKVTVTLPIITEGEPYEARSGAGVLVQSLHELEVRAVSSNIPESIHVDVSKLELNGPALHVKDLVVPDGLEVLTPGDEAVAALNGPQAEPVEEEAPEASTEADTSAEDAAAEDAPAES